MDKYGCSGIVKIKITASNMKKITLTKLTIKQAIFLALIYSLLTNLNDVKRGFIDGWDGKRNELEKRKRLDSIK